MSEPMPDAPVSRSRAFLQRVRRKLISLAPVVVGGVLVFVVLFLLSLLLIPLLPEDWRETIALLKEGDSTAARDRFRDLLASTGFPIEIAFLAFQVVQVLVAPIPGQLAGLLGGYLFGFWYGLLLTMTGLALGSLAAMLLGRLLGKHIVRKLMPAGLVEKFDKMIAVGGLWNFFFIYTLPVLPDDAVCFVAGLTRLSLWKLLAVMMLGRLPGMAVLCFVGASAGEGWTVGYVVFAVAMIFSLGFWLFSEEIEAWLLRRHQGEGAGKRPGDSTGPN
jgi:uncharacterized membrane protein YdjX (TVP38/TMEM64 family)